MDAQMGSCCDITLGRVPAMGSSSSLYRRRTRLPIYQSGQVSMISARSESTIKLSSGSETSKLGTNNRMFILGMGYVGQFLAQYMKEDGWAISGTCRSIAKKKELERKGFDVHLFDACDLQCNDIHTLRYCTHLLVSIPPVVPAGDQILQHEELVRKIALMGGNLRWLCYLSSTSVYGDCEGAWVNEDYPPNPTSKLANLRLEAEEGWLKLGTDLGLSTLVLRLGGIYGPGRSAIDTILEQVPLSSEGRKRRVSKRYTSRVHVADICQALKATTAVPISRKIYNVVDDDPASRAQVFAFSRELIEKRWPGLRLVKQIDDSTSTTTDVPKDEFVPVDEKRVSNARMKMELDIKLLHPSYRSGLQAVLDQIETPPGYMM